MLVIARIYSNQIYPRALLRVTATDRRGVRTIRTGVETGFMGESFFASIRPLAAGHLHGSKPPCWRAKESLGEDKGDYHINDVSLLLGLSRCVSCSPARRFCTTAT